MPPKGKKGGAKKSKSKAKSKEKGKGKGKEKGKGKGKKGGKTKAKQGKKTGKGEKVSKKAKEGEVSFLKLLGESAISQSAVLVMCSMLLAVALWTTSSYVHQQVDTKQLRSGIDQLNKMFPSEGKTTLQLFDEADSLVKELQNLTVLIDELEKDILEATSRINSGWKQKFNSLIYFSTDLVTWGGCKRTCERLNSTFMIIKNADMQNFLVQEIQIFNGVFWFALRTTGAAWSYGPGEPAGTQYWKTNPNIDQEPYPECAALGAPCDQPPNCWEKRRCNKRFRCLCQNTAKEKWLS